MPVETIAEERQRKPQLQNRSNLCAQQQGSASKPAEPPPTRLTEPAQTLRKCRDIMQSPILQCTSKLEEIRRVPSEANRPLLADSSCGPGGSAEPYSRKGSAEPCSRGGPAEPYSRKGSAEPYSRDGSAEPYSRGGPAEPCSRKGSAEPCSRGGSAEPY
ncbi:unnamed protein product, partial [Toxocara canis]